MIPQDAELEYCGRSHLIVELDSEGQQRETNEGNNAKAIPLIIICEKGETKGCVRPKNVVCFL